MPEKVSEKQIKPNKQQIEDDSLTNITWLGRMGVNSIMPIPIEKDKNSSLNSQVCLPDLNLSFSLGCVVISACFYLLIVITILNKY